ncbi:MULTISPECIES: hypothetical protein [Methanosarcina]|nr:MULTISPECIES: hypothetical protein [Methanosarcina]
MKFMKRSSGRDVLQKKNPGNGFFRKEEVKGEKRRENKLKIISSGDVFR